MNEYGDSYSAVQQAEQANKSRELAKKEASINRLNSIVRGIIESRRRDQQEQIGNLFRAKAMDLQEKALENQRALGLAKFEMDKKQFEERKKATGEYDIEQDNIGSTLAEQVFKKNSAISKLEKEVAASKNRPLIAVQQHIQAGRVQRGPNGQIIPSNPAYAGVAKFLNDALSTIPEEEARAQSQLDALMKERNAMLGSASKSGFVYDDGTGELIDARRGKRFKYNPQNSVPAAAQNKGMGFNPFVAPGPDASSMSPMIAPAATATQAAPSAPDMGVMLTPAQQPPMITGQMTQAGPVAWKSTQPPAGQVLIQGKDGKKFFIPAGNAAAAMARGAIIVPQPVIH